MGIWLFWGQEDYTLEEKISSLKKKFVVEEFSSMSYKTFDNPSFNELTEILCTPPLMFGSVFIVINCENYFNSSKNELSFTDKELTQFDEILASLNENINVAFVYKIARTSKNKAKIDTRRKIYKILAKYAQVEEFPMLKTYDKELPAWIKKRAVKKDIILSNESMTLLIELCGSNLRIIDNELEKLKLYAYPNKDIKPTDIKLLCNPIDDIFKIIDFYSANKKDCAVNELRKVNEKQYVLATLSALNTNVRNSLKMKLMSETMSNAQISSITGVHEYRVKKQLEKLRKISTRQLIELKKKLVKAEYQAKSGITPEKALEMAFM